jgi:hypothetical protein
MTQNLKTLFDVPTPYPWTRLLSVAAFVGSCAFLRGRVGFIALLFYAMLASAVTQFAVTLIVRAGLALTKSVHAASGDTLVNGNTMPLSERDINDLERAKWSLYGIYGFFAALAIVVLAGLSAYLAFRWHDHLTVDIDIERPVPASKAVHMGVDLTGRPAVCINGAAYDVPAVSDEELVGRFPPSQVGDPLSAQMFCRN